MKEKIKIFDNEVYEQQRLNIERLAEEYPDDWFYKIQMELPPERRIGFAPKVVYVLIVIKILPKEKRQSL